MNKGRIEGIILAAGRGTRMLPLTERLPKPLLPVTGVPLIDIAASKLLRCGASMLHVNLYHLGDMIERRLTAGGWPVTFHRELRLLDTGGGIGNMAAKLGEADHVLLLNGDVLSSFGYEDALEAHIGRKALVTLILMRGGDGMRTPPPAVTLDGDGAVTAIGADLEAESGALGYTGMAVLSGEALGYFPAEKKGLVPVLREMISRSPGSVTGFDVSAGPADGAGRVWGEIGSPSSYIDLHRRIVLERTCFDESLPPPGFPLRIGEGASIDPGAQWKGFLDICAGATVEEGTFLEDCVVLEGAVVRKGTRLRSAIVYDGEALEVGK